MFPAFLLSCLLLPAGPAVCDESHRAPNIVFVLTDDQGYGELGCHGNPIIRTPNLDRMRGESLRFTDFHVSPTCAPTRCSLMTGRHEFRSGVTHTIFERERMSLKAVTIAQVLHAAGYTTGIFGKWHLGDEPPYQPERRGFDEVFIHGGGGIGQTYPGSCGDAPRNSYFDPAILHNGRFEKTTGFCTDVFFGQALKWIETQGKTGRPFFAYITPNAPHGPYTCPESYAKLYEGKTYLDKPLSENAKHYYGMITNIDDNVGKLLARIKEWGLEPRTLVIFMTDNGHSISGIYNAGMRGTKGTPYQGGKSLLLSNAARFALSFGVLVVPSILMGATLPLLSRFCSETRSMIGRRVGVLYGANTLGGAAGCFAAGYWMIQTLGLTATTRLAAGVNLALAAAVAAAYFAWGRRGAAEPGEAPAENSSAPLAGEDPDAAGANPRLRLALLAVAFVSGLAGLACEGLWARYLAFYSNYTYGFTNLLGAYLLGLGGGALLYRVALAGVRRRLRLLAAVELLVGLAVFLCFALGAVLYTRTIYSHVLPAFTMALITVLLPALLMGIAFPLLCGAYAHGVGSVGRSVGLLYALNTAGSIAGALAPVFVTIPLFGVQGSIGVFALMYWAMAVLLLALCVPAGGRSAGRAVVSAGCVLALAALVVVPHDLCTRVFLGTSPWLGRHQEVAFWGEGRTATAIVVRDRVNDFKRVYINQSAEVPTTYPNILCFKLMGALGPLLQAQPDRVLIVAFGGGVAAGTVARFPDVKSVTVVELEPSVIGAARLLERENNGALADPKISIAIEDGRNYLLNSPDQWPVVVCDSTHPKSADSWVLYTQEFYRTVRGRLSGDGVFVQWLPNHALRAAEYRIIVRTFQSVFPHTSLWMSRGVDECGLETNYTLLVGTMGRLSVPVAQIQRRLQQPPVAADLQPWGLDTAVGVLETFVCAEEALREWVGHGPVNTDDLPITQYDTALARSGETFSLASLLGCLQSIRPYLTPSGPQEEQDRLGAALERHLEAGRSYFAGDLLRAHELLPDDPKMAATWRNFEGASSYYSKAGQFYSDVPAALVWLAGKVQRLPNGLDAAAALCEQAVAVRPDYVPGHKQLGGVLAIKGEPNRAIEHLAVVLKARPDDAQTNYTMGNMMAATGKFAEAEGYFRKAVRVQPSFLWARLDLAHALAEQKHFDEAEVVCRQAVALSPGHPTTHYALASVLMRQGKRQEAAAEFAAVLRIAPDHADARRELASVQTQATKAPPSSTGPP